MRSRSRNTVFLLNELIGRLLGLKTLAGRERSDTKNAMKYIYEHTNTNRRLHCQPT